MTFLDALASLVLMIVTHGLADWKLIFLYHLSSHHWDWDTSQSLKMEYHSKWNIRSKFKWQKNIWTKIYPRPQPTMMEKSKEKRICGTLKLFQLYSVKWYMPSEVQKRKKMLQRRLCLYLNENNISDIAMTLSKKKR